MATFSNVIRNLLVIQGQYQASGAVNAAIRDVERLQQSVTGLTRGLADIGTSIVGALTTSAGVQFVEKVADKAQNAAKQVELTNRMIENLGDRTSITIENSAALIERVSKDMILSRSQVGGAMQDLIKLGFTGLSQINQVMEQARNLRALTGDSFRQSVALVGRAAFEPGTAIGILRRARIGLTAEQQKLFAFYAQHDDAISAFNLSMKILADRFAGLSDIEKKYEQDSMRIEKAHGALETQIGKHLMPTVQAARETFAGWLEMLVTDTPAVQKAQAAVVALGTGFSGLLTVASATRVAAQIGGWAGSFLKFAGVAGQVVVGVMAVRTAMKALGDTAEDRATNLNAIVKVFEEWSGLKLPKIGDWLYELELGVGNIAASKEWDNFKKQALELAKVLTTSRDQVAKALKGESDSGQMTWLENVKELLRQTANELERIKGFFMWLKGEGPFVLPLDIQFDPALAKRSWLETAKQIRSLWRSDEIFPGIRLAAPPSSFEDRWRAQPNIWGDVPPGPALPPSPPGPMPDMPHGHAFRPRQHGGPVAPGGTALVGERGPELVRFPGTGGYVHPDPRMVGGGGDAGRRFVQPYGIFEQFQEALKESTKLFKELNEQIERLLGVFRTLFAPLARSGGGGGGALRSGRGGFRPFRRGDFGDLTPGEVQRAMAGGMTTADVARALQGFPGGMTTADVAGAMAGGGLGGLGGRADIAGASAVAQNNQGAPAPHAAAQEAISFFMSKGWTREQAAGIAANIQAESSFNAGAVGDRGQARGLAQWHPDRQRAIERQFGKSLSQMSRTEQMEAIHWELTQGGERAAGERLRGATTAAEAGSIISQYYERPADRYGAAAHRGRLAARMAAGEQNDPNANTPAGAAGMIPGKSAGLGGPLSERLAAMYAEMPDWVKQGFSVTSGRRSTAEQAALFRAKPGLAAPPGRSKHEHGAAADLAWGSPAARAWFHANAERYGLHFPMMGQGRSGKYEPWHVEALPNWQGQLPATQQNAPDIWNQPNAAIENVPQESPQSTRRLPPTDISAARAVVQNQPDINRPAAVAANTPPTATPPIPRPRPITAATAGGGTITGTDAGSATDISAAATSMPQVPGQNVPGWQQSIRPAVTQNHPAVNRPSVVPENVPARSRPGWQQSIIRRDIASQPAAVQNNPAANAPMASFENLPGMLGQMLGGGGLMGGLGGGLGGMLSGLLGRVFGGLGGMFSGLLGRLGGLFGGLGMGGPMGGLGGSLGGLFGGGGGGGPMGMLSGLLGGAGGPMGMLGGMLGGGGGPMGMLNGMMRGLGGMLGGSARAAAVAQNVPAAAAAGGGGIPFLAGSGLFGGMTAAMQNTPRMPFQAGNDLMERMGMGNYRPESYSDWRSSIGAEIGQVLRDKQAVELQGRGMVDINLRGATDQVSSMWGAGEGNLGVNLGIPKTGMLWRPGDPGIAGSGVL